MDYKALKEFSTSISGFDTRDTLIAKCKDERSEDKQPRVCRVGGGIDHQSI